MITDDEVMRLFEEADPARGRDDTGSFLETTRHLQVVQTRSIDWQATEKLPTVTPTRRHPRRTITGIAAAFLLVAVGAVVSVARNDPTPETVVAAGAPANAKQAEEVARNFLDVYGAFDADRAMTFLSERAVAAEWGTPAELRFELMLLQASGWKHTIRDTLMREPPPGSDGCDASDFYKKKLAPGRFVVYCTYNYHALRSDAIGRGPYGAYWAFVVDKGRIVSAENRIDKAHNFFPDQMWDPFRRWVASAYPQDAAAMYQGTSGSDWKRSVESIRLWDLHSREYVAAGAPYIARAEAICTAAHERLEATFGPPPTGPFDANVNAYKTYDAMSARVLEEALAELRAVPPPEAFREQFDQAYAAGDQLVRELRGEPHNAAFGSARHWVGGQPGLHECTFNLPG